MSSPKAWRLLSTLALLLFLVAWLSQGFGSVPQWGWVALLLSGIAFGVELALLAIQRRRTPRSSR